MHTAFDGRRWRVTPDTIDEFRARDRLVGTYRENSEDGTLPRSTESDLVHAHTGPHLAQQLYPHGLFNSATALQPPAGTRIAYSA
ncbi:hypothetical protein AORI_5484 [Amycolatopsis keratiniphila]|uniref:Uncharacterized protein n=1 Tax=Amycolatopsis keratiniphila TaxID=129921 RepID=R4TB62_9PSEU|nr:hypothetical protein AORI_5484 [Amycolatopsis keratiniphila]